MLLPLLSAANTDPPTTCGSNSGRLQHLFTVPFWNSVLDLAAARREVEQIVLRKYAELEYSGFGPEETNNNFFGLQWDGDAAWIKARDACLLRLGLGPTAPAALQCEEEADAAAWPELRQSQGFRVIRQALREQVAHYLSAADIQPFRNFSGCVTSDVEDVRCWELDSTGGPILWTWAAVHKSGVHHPEHDHPQSLASGTFYLSCPPGSGKLMLMDPRRDATEAQWAAGDTKTEVGRDPEAFSRWVAHASVSMSAPSPPLYAGCCTPAWMSQGRHLHIPRPLDPTCLAQAIRGITRRRFSGALPALAAPSGRANRGRCTKGVDLVQRRRQLGRVSSSHHSAESTILVHDEQ